VESRDGQEEVAGASEEEDKEKTGAKVKRTRP
jgi:hypothetical protein